MGKPQNLLGKTYNNLTVVKRGLSDNHGRTRWWCKCNCNNPELVLVEAYNLKSGHTKSCGCLNKEQASKMGKNSKKFNRYDLSNDFGIGYTDKDEPFYFDLDDYKLIKNYCWCYSDKGYVVTHSDCGIRTSMHRMVMHVTDPYIQIDHIYHINHDNRKSELRLADNSKNQMNKSIQKNNSSGVTGVYLHKPSNKWVARVNINEKETHLGSFDNFNDAVEARIIAEEKYYKDFAYRYNN